MRLLLLLVVVVLVMIWISRARKPSQPDIAARRARKREPDGEPMVCCSHCGIYLPESEALTTPAGVVFCSEEHRLQHDRH